MVAGRAPIWTHEMIHGNSHYVYGNWHVIHKVCAMRTNIDIDDDLIAEAMATTGLTTKKAVVEEALRRLVQRHHRRNAVADMAGLRWEGDPDAMREGREPGQNP
jgi:Arc/MetJ family transcription regulator